MKFYLLYISLSTHQQFKTRDTDFVLLLLLLLFFFLFFPSVLTKYMLLFLFASMPITLRITLSTRDGIQHTCHKPLHTYPHRKHTCIVFLHPNQHLNIHVLSFNLCFRIPDHLARVVEGRKSPETMALRILRCILFLYKSGVST